MKNLRIIRSTERFDTNDIVVHLMSATSNRTIIASYQTDSESGYECTCGDYPEIQGVPSLKFEELNKSQIKEAIEGLLLLMAKMNVPVVSLVFSFGTGSTDEFNTIENFFNGMTFEISDFGIIITLDKKTTEELRLRCQDVTFFIIDQ